MYVGSLWSRGRGNLVADLGGHPGIRGSYKQLNRTFAAQDRFGVQWDRKRMRN